MRSAVLLLAAATILAGCDRTEKRESAEDFAARVEGGRPQATGPANPGLPRVATDAKRALRTGAAYIQPGADGQPNSLAIYPDGTYALSENGRTQRGKWHWLPDGKRLQLEGVTYGSVVLIADGAVYRMQNADVPFDDVTTDRMFSLSEGTTGGE